MYANKLAVAVKHRGKVLQEFGEVVYLPFGSEYTLLIKNLNTVRAAVNVSIDGRDATEGVSLVVQPNSSIEVERFIKSGNLQAGNRFKFIERNAAVEAHRGARVDDGVIVVKYSFELVRATVGWPVFTTPTYPSTGVNPNWWPPSTVCGSSFNTSLTKGGELTRTFEGGSSTASIGAVNASTVSPSAGITAPGGVSHQQFSSAGWFETEAVQHVIAFKLAGQAAETGRIERTVYARSKVDCTVCGYKARPSSKFCSQCGASLNIIG